ncbi:cysteine/O-acetylserine exporter [Pseudovibrio sp. Ad46]|uniref:LysE family translocator n=1 Tax=Pseudovibrio sp. Ad46 TaxID=989432 RepID=UPI0007AEA579|nr:LysE family transporter [Pseudovibrio sp. Ad46]KZK94015.1 cysteine/O-acetylserine exporter [Pseudovibrio sp. Ad46]
MDWATLSAFAIFVAIMTGTPGPGNLTFMAIGASAGYRTAFPVIIAAELGSLLLNLCVAFGLGQLMARGGLMVNAFKFTSMAYMTYLAWRIVQLNIKPKGEVSLPTFWEGLLIHPLSPKTWAMSLVAFTSFFAANGMGLYENAAILTAGFLIGGMISHSVWAMVGVSILKVIGEGALMRGITIAMAIAMLAATAWSLLL